MDFEDFSISDADYHEWQRQQEISRRMIGQFAHNRKTETSADLLNLSLLPNADDVRGFIHHFLQFNTCVILLFGNGSFAVCQSEKCGADEIEALLLIDGREQVPELWLACDSEARLCNAMDANLQVLLLSCARNDISVHLRSVINYSFFEEYLI